jgi:hypothetical protein
MSPLQVDVSWDGVIATVMVAGDLDFSTAPGLAERLGRSRPPTPNGWCSTWAG